MVFSVTAVATPAAAILVVISVADSLHKRTAGALHAVRREGSW
jgi:hypothetical protein